MATHNHLLKLGPGRFLEIIAVDPQAPPPDRPRWFGLDDPGLRRILEQGPGIVGWVARTQHIAEIVARSRVPLGPPEAISRACREVGTFTSP